MGVADAVVTPNVLAIYDSAKISPDEVHTIRKRMATPMTTPMAMAALREHCSTANMDSEQESAHFHSCWEERRTMNAMPAESELREFYAHLQELSGTKVNTSADPVVFTAGLPALASLFVALLQKGGSDVLDGIRWQQPAERPVDESIQHTPQVHIRCAGRYRHLREHSAAADSACQSTRVRDADDSTVSRDAHKPRYESPRVSAGGGNAEGPQGQD